MSHKDKTTMRIGCSQQAIGTHRDIPKENEEVLVDYLTSWLGCHGRKETEKLEAYKKELDEDRAFIGCIKDNIARLQKNLDMGEKDIGYYTDGLETVNGSKARFDEVRDCLSAMPLKDEFRKKLDDSWKGVEGYIESIECLAADIRESLETAKKGLEEDRKQLGVEIAKLKFHETELAIDETIYELLDIPTGRRKHLFRKLLLLMKTMVKSSDSVYLISTLSQDKTRDTYKQHIDTVRKMAKEDAKALATFLAK